MCAITDKVHGQFFLYFNFEVKQPICKLKIYFLFLQSVIS